MSTRHNAAEWLVGRHVREGRGARVAVESDGVHTTYDELQAELFRGQNALADLDSLPKTATGKIKRYALRQTLGSWR